VDITGSGSCSSVKLSGSATTGLVINQLLGSVLQLIQCTLPVYASSITAFKR